MQQISFYYCLALIKIPSSAKEKKQIYKVYKNTRNTETEEVPKKLIN